LPNLLSEANLAPKASNTKKAKKAKNGNYKNSKYLILTLVFTTAYIRKHDD
jgi:hypothetical protein